MAKFDVILASPRGFCAGVERAIEIVERALIKYDRPVYVHHEIVHNKYVVNELREKGAIFVDDLNLIPKGAITILSAHGVSQAVEDKAINLGLGIIDATCPLVKKVHKEAMRYEETGKQIILIGHAGHPEVEGTSGRVHGKVILVQSVMDANTIEVDDEDNIAYVTQTTLSVDDTKAIIEVLYKRFPNIEGPNLKDICYATQNRQDAVRKLSKEVDLILVVGSANSSNSNRLRDLAIEQGIKSYLIDGPEDINPIWFSSINAVGITAGASAPEVLLERVIDRLAEFATINVRTQSGVEENVRFKLPNDLQSVA